MCIDENKRRHCLRVNSKTTGLLVLTSLLKLIFWAQWLTTNFDFVDQNVNCVTRFSFSDKITVRDFPVINTQWSPQWSIHNDHHKIEQLRHYTDKVITEEYSGGKHFVIIAVFSFKNNKKPTFVGMLPFLWTTHKPIKTYLLLTVSIH